MKTIRQGKPDPRHFIILQPVPGGMVSIGDEVECVNPKTSKSTYGTCVDLWTFDWIDLRDGFCLLTFGVDAKTLKQAICAKEEFRDKERVSFLLIKETV